MVPLCATTIGSAAALLKDTLLPRCLAWVKRVLSARPPHLPASGACQPSALTDQGHTGVGTEKGSEYTGRAVYRSECSAQLVCLFPRNWQAGAPPTGDAVVKR
eukprot:scaffold191592_cov32-Tisochrysis_lutea.AAC.4